ncbi:MAG: MBOAT family protein [Lachnospiraceae bacterium]|nr:MBOAT family protein [Lachnospiraceae bacterium]
MLFNSFSFLIFFPIVTLCYYLIPHRFRYLWLLAASYFFYMCWEPRYALLLLGSTAVTYVCARLLGRAEKISIRRLILIISLVLNFGILFLYKYLEFFLINLNSLLKALHIELSVNAFSLVLPVGISFYIFQAVGYTIDVYRKELAPEKNFFKYAVFVSFFPQLVAGPIERAGNLLHQFEEKHFFEWKRVKNGLLLMLWGFFLKVVVADRIAIFVDAVFDDFYNYGGWYLVVASILFAIQIYCDFAGYSTIAIGAASVMGFTLMENFHQPYLAVSVKEFWRRWHISLTGWFRDYLYIPLGGNRKGKVRKYVNNLIVFFLSGLWHGAMWNYVIWGGLNGLYLVIADLFAPVKEKVRNLVHWDPEASSNRLLGRIVTFVLVDFSWIFFRSQGTTQAFQVLHQMTSVRNIGVLLDGSLYQLGLDQRNFWLMMLSIVLLFVVDSLHERGLHVRAWLEKQNLWCRILVPIVLIETILIFGIWGSNYDASAFIYFRF